jgi:uncharacterized membrane protein
MLFAVVIAGVVSMSVVQGNYILPLIIAITAAVVLYIMKRQVTGVLADERDYLVAGKAARWASSIYAILAAAGSMVLMAMRAENPIYETIAQVLAYSACFLLIMQSILFKIFSK